jgi:hypothetical protein
MIDVSKASMKELVEYYNTNSGKSAIKKFADRKTAERRCSALVVADATIGKPKKPTAKSKHQQHKVMVDGVAYRSTKAAFEALKLPLGRHIQFRMKLKAAGKLAFENGDKKITFAIVQE